MGHDSNPKISIITVVYNGEDTIEQAIQSVLRQKYSNLEYIMIDGDSIDRTNEIIGKYRDGISYYISESDAGIYDAMNKGVRHATGDIIAFLNSDDWYEPEILQKVAKYFIDRKIDVVFGCVYKIKERRIICRVEPDLSKINLSMPCCHQAIFARRELFQKVGLFDTRYSVSADYDWIMRVYNAGAKILCVEDVFANYRISGYSHRQEYILHAEAAQIALENAKRRKLDFLSIKIQKDWNEWKKLFLYRQTCNRDIEYIKNLLDQQADYYIWGTGFYGRECCRLFTLLQIRIKGFIDNYDNENYVEGYPVIRPSQIQKDGLICIAVIRYEDEIISQLKEMALKPDRYFLFSALRDKIALYGMEKNYQEVDEYQPMEK